MDSSCRADLFSESQRIKYTIETRTQDIPDARSYLLALKDIRVKYVLMFKPYLYTSITLLFAFLLSLSMNFPILPPFFPLFAIY